MQDSKELLIILQEYIFKICIFFNLVYNDWAFFFFPSKKVERRHLVLINSTECKMPENKTGNLHIFLSNENAVKRIDILE